MKTIGFYIKAFKNPINVSWIDKLSNISIAII